MKIYICVEQTILNISVCREQFIFIALVENIMLHHFLIRFLSFNHVNMKIYLLFALSQTLQRLIKSPKYIDI